MGRADKTINVRLSPETMAKFDDLAKLIPGLRRGAIIRCLLTSMLSKPLSEQVRLVTEQILAPEVTQRGENRIRGSGNRQRRV